MEVSSFSDLDAFEDNSEAKEREEAIRQCSRAVCHNVDTAGVNWLIGEVATKCTHDKESVRKEACWLFQVVIEERTCCASLPYVFVCGCSCYCLEFCQITGK